METTFTCRCCGRDVAGNFNGATVEQGWRFLERLDGPNHVCPSCVEAGETALDHLREEYETVRVGNICPTIF